MAAAGGEVFAQVAVTGVGGVEGPYHAGGMEAGMRRDEILRMLREAHPDLAARFGVRSLSLFGSVARGEDGPESDVDLLVDFDRPTGYFGLFRLQRHLEELLGGRVDLGTAGSLKAPLRDEVLSEAIRVA